MTEEEKPDEGPLGKYSGLQKAAILLMSLDQETASTLMRKLGHTMQEDVARELVVLESVPTDIRSSVMEEFYQMAMARDWAVEGGLRYARDLLHKSMDFEDAERLFESISQTAQRTPFAFLQKAETENLLTFIQDEHPQTIALILCHLPHDKCAEILLGLSEEKQVEVVKRVANMDRTNPEVIREVEKGLEGRLAALLSQRFEKAGGVDTVAEILNLVDRTTERTIFEGIEEDDPDLVEEIRRRMFVFEDVLRVEDKGIQTVLKEIDNEELAVALKTASPELQEKIFTNMSERASTMIQEDMQFMGPVRVADIEAAQQRIVDVVRRLEESGDIVIMGRGGENEAVG